MLRIYGVARDQDWYKQSVFYKTIIIIIIIEIKYTGFFLSIYQFHFYYLNLFHLLGLFSSWAFLLSLFVIFFYYTYYYCILSKIYYNNEKARKFRPSGLLLLLYILYFYCTLLIALELELITNFFNSINTICKFSRTS